MQANPTSGSNGCFRKGFWRLADPKVSLASLAGMFMAAAIAAADQALTWPWLMLTVAGVFAVEIAKNAAGELVDYDSGTDLEVSTSERTPFSGGKRVMVDHLLSRRQTAAIAMGFYALAIAIGMIIVVLRDQRVLYLGLAGMALAFFYYQGPFRLSYRGWGELAVAISYGPLVVLGTYLVQTAGISPLVLHASWSFGLLVAAFLWINEFPDYRADHIHGKRNLVVQLSLRPASHFHLGIVTVAHAGMVTMALTQPGCLPLLGGLLGLPASAFSVWRTYRSHGRVPAVIPAQVASLAGFVLMACGVAIAALLS